MNNNSVYVVTVSNGSENVRKQIRNILTLENIALAL